MGQLWCNGSTPPGADLVTHILIRMYVCVQPGELLPMKFVRSVNDEGRGPLLKCMVKARRDDAGAQKLRRLADDYL